MYANISYDDCRQMLEDLVRIDSVNPFESNGKDEAELASFLESLLRSYGMTVKTQEVMSGRKNVIGILKGNSESSPSLMLNGHLDTVGVEGMIIDPFKPYLDEKGQLHGRCACDMKGSLTSMIMTIRELADAGIELEGSHVFVGVIDEEYKSVGMTKLIKEYRTDAALVGEPTGMKIGVACKGYGWIEVGVQGQLAHGSVAEQGINAIQKASKLVSELERLQDEYGKISHPLLGSPKIMISMIEGGTEWSVVPHFCTLSVERRLLPGETTDAAVGEIQQIIDDLSKRDHKFRATVRKVFEQKPMEVSREEALVKHLARAINDEFDGKAELIGTPYWTDASLLVNEAKISACIFGPGDIRVAHSPDEYVLINDVTLAARIYSRLARSFCKSGNN